MLIDIVDDIRLISLNWSQILRSQVFQQVAPLVIFLLIPILVLSSQSYIYSLFNYLLMVLESLSLVLPWNWISSNDGERERRKLKKKAVRTRAGQQAALNGDADDDGYYPGIVNISGTYCFMDSTLQALASLSYLTPHIELIQAKAEQLDVATPVLDALLDILHTLNTPTSSPHAIRPHAMINALSSHSESKQNSLFSSREHQDAQELFQLISECLKDETIAVDKEGYRDRGLGGVGLLPSTKLNGSAGGKHSGNGKNTSKWRKGVIGKSVFDGLTANRRSCVQCGYTEAVMHFAFDNLQLAVPRAAACRLEDCLGEYTRLEILDDCICRKCSLLATYDRLKQENDRIVNASSSSTDPNHSPTSTWKKKKAREAKKLLLRVESALQEGRIEDDLKDVKIEKVFSRASTKQAMIARPPPILALHLNRSVHWGNYASKNNCNVLFPEFLDLTQFTTSGKLSVVPSSPISSPPPPFDRSSTPTPVTYSSHDERVLYRLSSIVCHYGQHSFGHYVCYRRKPPSPLSPNRNSTPEDRFPPPRVWCAAGLSCQCEVCQRYGHVRISKDGSRDRQYAHGTGSGWLRISDDSVSECGIETVLREGQGAFMLYYEKVQWVSPSPPRAIQHQNDSRETATTSTASTSSNPSASTSTPTYRHPSSNSIPQYPRDTSNFNATSRIATTTSTSTSIPNGHLAEASGRDGVDSLYEADFESGSEETLKPTMINGNNGGTNLSTSSLVSASSSSLPSSSASLAQTVGTIREAPAANGDVITGTSSATSATFSETEQRENLGSKYTVTHKLRERTSSKTRKDNRSISSTSSSKSIPSSSSKTHTS
ncbi:hypothetical protein C8Q75DRAFT_229747 [Abortiporus biennis]|nr:hypothetical protein C8Q75DRAFT_229747 [Abortiporus biennis]